MIAGLVLHAGLASAQSERTAEPVQTAVAKTVCVDAEVDGVRTLSYTCLSRRLAPEHAPNIDDGKGPNASEKLANGPSNQVGTFNLSAERIRFGSNWGKSVFPQRPPPLQAPPVGH